MLQATAVTPASEPSKVQEEGRATRADVWAACLRSSLLLTALAVGVRTAVPQLNSSLLHTDAGAVAGLLAGDAVLHAQARMS